MPPRNSRRIISQERVDAPAPYPGVEVTTGNVIATSPVPSYSIGFSIEPINVLGVLGQQELVVSPARRIVSTTNASDVQGYYHTEIGTSPTVWHYIPGSGPAQAHVSMERLEIIQADPTALTGPLFGEQAINSFTGDVYTAGRGTIMTSNTAGGAASWDPYYTTPNNVAYYAPPPEIYVDSRVEPMAEIIKGFRK
jgi:hypothetical protein